MKETKQKRIKKVFSSASEVLHRWANQTQEEARCKNVFFKGPKVWSYGYHYELGRIVSYKGIRVALINSEYASQTTAKHQSYAESAASHMINLRVSDFSSVPKAMLERQNLLIKFLTDHLTARKTYSENFKDAYEYKLIVEFNSWCDQLKLKTLKIDLESDFISTIDAVIRDTREKTKVKRAEEERLSKIENAEYEKVRAEQDRLEKEIERQEKERAKEVLSRWVKGGNFDDCLHHIEPEMIRIKGNQVQTTGQMTIDLKSARAAYTALKSGQLKVGQEVEGFEVLIIKGDRLKIGCHDFSIKHLDEVLGRRLEVIK